jgi:hypothetical protein
MNQSDNKSKNCSAKEVKTNISNKCELFKIIQSYANVKKCLGTKKLEPE